MQRTHNRSHLALTAVVIGLTWIGGSNADDGSRDAIVAKTTAVQSTAKVTSEQRFDLRAYGDRFKLAIEAIENDSRKPEWTWDDSDDDGRIARKR